MQLPKMTTVKQRFDTASIGDVEAETERIIHESGLLHAVTPGSRVAVGSGSRGIVKLVEITRTLCRCIRDAGGEPFIFPAMGSHGGATSEGQKDVLAALGITRESTGTEILSDADGVLIGATADGVPLYVDKNALKADHIVMINRVKPHTKFKGPVESGIAKMLSVGMGKVQGAEVLHRSAVRLGFAHVIMTAAQEIINKLPFLLGLAIVETPLKSVHSLTLIKPQTIFQQEEELLKTASAVMARIPVRQTDLLIVDRIGKDISGTGMDTNVIGRNRDILGDFSTPPNPLRILVLDLTDRTCGNANGIGFADFSTQRLREKTDLEKTYKNALTAMSPEKAAMPVCLENDRDAVAAALRSVGFDDAVNARIVRIRNTSDLEFFQVSGALLEELHTEPRLEFPKPPVPFSFDAANNLMPF